MEHFKSVRVLKNDLEKKSLVLLGHLGDPSQNAILRLEKEPFPAEKELPENASELYFENDVFHRYHAQFSQASVNTVDAELIYPASQKHIQKYSKVNYGIHHETPELYEKVTRKYIESIPVEDIRWLYNVLEGLAEVDRFIYQDRDEAIGYSLRMDYGFDPKKDDMEKLHLLAICYRRDLKSLRDLTKEHLPLLKNIEKTAPAAIEKAYGVPADKIRAYIHYLPSYFHLHVHFTHINAESRTCQTERAHLLSSVIQNIELCGDYYQRAMLTVSVSEDETISRLLRDAQC